MSKERKNPHARTQERFKYRNAAVMQGGILGVDKLVLITMCEFAKDDGVLYHGIRSLAAATGLKKDQVARSIKRLCELYGVVLLIEKGRGRRHASRYKILIGAMPETSVYDLVKAKNRKENEKTAAEASRGETVETVSSARQLPGSTVSPGGQLNSTVSSAGQFEANRLTRGTKDVDVDSIFTQGTDAARKYLNPGSDAPCLAPEEQNQNQPRTGSVSKDKGNPVCQSCRQAPAVGRRSIPGRASWSGCRSCLDINLTQEISQAYRSTLPQGAPEPKVIPAEFVSRHIKHLGAATADIQSDDPSRDNYVRPL